MRLVLAIMLSGGSVSAQSGIEIPSIGAIVDSSGSLRFVQGIAGNFSLGPAKVRDVLSAACSEQVCLAKTDSKILSSTGEVDSPDGPAIFSITGVEAIVFFPESRTFMRWHDNTLHALDWTVDGDVVSVQATAIAVRREGCVWIVDPNGSVIDWVANIPGPVLLLPEGILFATPDKLVLRRKDATEVQFDLTGAENITAMGPHYVAIHTGDVIYALRTEPDRESLYQLPGATP